MQKDLNNTEDINSDVFFGKMNNISSNFSLLKEGEPRILYMKGYIDAYLGKEGQIQWFW